MVDRKKDIFKYKGHHINPSEVENVIQALKGVEFVAVVGIPDDACFALPAAIIKRKAGYEDFNEQDVIDLVANTLPPYKQLHGGVFFVEALPLTATGKIQKRDTRDLAVKMFNERKNWKSTSE